MHYPNTFRRDYPYYPYYPKPRDGVDIGWMGDASKTVLLILLDIVLPGIHPCMK